jgi:hypothetical protein
VHNPSLSARGPVGSTSRVSDVPWFRAIVLAQLSLFLVPAIIAWTSTLTRTAFIPLVALPVALCVGAVLLVSRAWRTAGRRIIAGTVVAAALEVALTIVLIAAYSSANPGRDLS